MFRNVSRKTFNEAVKTNGGMYHPMCMFHQISKKILKRFDIAIHGHGFDYFFQGMYIPRNRLKIFKKDTHILIPKSIPKDITKFLQTFKMKNISFCKGTRFLNKGRREIPFIRYYGNICLTFLSRITCKNYIITDVVNGFLGIKLKLLKKINLNSLSKDFFF